MVAVYNYVYYRANLEAVKSSKEEVCAFSKKKTKRGIRSSTVKTTWNMKTLGDGKKYEVDSSLLLGVEASEDELRQGVPCVIAREPRDMFFRVEEIKAQKVDSSWQKVGFY